MSAVTAGVDHQGMAMITIPLAQIVPWENVRRTLGDVGDLAASIEAVGLLEPLIVAPAADGTYDLIAGYRRRAALVRLGRTEAECVVRTDLDDTGRVTVQLVENLQRADLGPLEEAEGYRRLQALGLTQVEIAKRCAVGQANVSKKLSLLALAPDVQAELYSGRISVDAALGLLPSRKPRRATPTADPEPERPVVRRRRGEGPSSRFHGRMRSAEGIAKRRARLAARAALIEAHRAEYERLVDEALGTVTS